MPCAGAVVPPAIIPLRKQIPGKPSTHIDTCTYIELDTGKIFTYFGKDEYDCCNIECCLSLIVLIVAGPIAQSVARLTCAKGGEFEPHYSQVNSAFHPSMGR